jgi:hypothetical protein
MKKKLFLSGILGVALVFAIAVIGCDNDDGDEGKNTDPTVYFLSGSFGDVQFNLESSSETSPSASVKGRSISRAVGDSYDLNGVLKDGAVLARLRGSYDLDSGNWSVSARSSNDVVYTFDGRIDNAGVFRGAGATIVIPPSESAKEWTPSFSPVTKSDTAWDFAGNPAESEASGMPSFAHGSWNAYWEKPVLGATADGAKVSTSLRCIISDWKIKVIGTETREYGGDIPVDHIPIDQNQTIIEVIQADDGSYEVISCYPEYVPTAENYAAALTECLGLEERDIAIYDQEYPTEQPDGRWVYMSAQDRVTVCGGFLEEDNDKMLEFYAVNGWEAWAAANEVEPMKKYAKYKFVFTDDNVSFKMIQLIEGKEDGTLWPMDFANTYAFDSLEALKAADLQEEHKVAFPHGKNGPHEDLGVLEMPFTRN